MIRSYSEMLKFESFGERLKYLQLFDDTDASPRQISLSFYESRPWRLLRAQIIERDYNSDLSVLGVGIDGRILVHHINTLNESDFLNWNVDKLLNPENLITVSYDTHSKIHYGLESYEMSKERLPGDTKLW